jgi:2-polyprenyl-6-methoxyphenol hydroxylase-like FAD-dependent oxidoreductase
MRVQVAIVGAGPTGLALAGELGLAGISCCVLERRTEEPNLTRAFAVHARTLELLDARGLADQLVAKGIPVTRVAPAPGATLDLSGLPSGYQMVLIIAQSGTERLLEQRAREHGVQIARGAEVTGLSQSEHEVSLELANGQTVTADYVVGTDGAHSTVRTLIGTDFVGAQYETHIMLADVRLASSPGETLFGMSSPEGLTLFVPFGDGWFRAIVWDRTREKVPLAEPITLAELRDSFHRIAGDDYGMGEPRWSTRFLSERRQARHYRSGRVFLAGDAAHVHSPIGGQGMNTGIQDAMNLGWKLAAVLRGSASPDLLDSYEKERHPVGESVLKLTDALYKLVLSGSRLGLALRQNVIRLVTRIGPARRQIAMRLTGLGIAYPAPAGAHKLTGQRMPDFSAGGQRLYEVMRSGQFVLACDSPDLGAFAGRVGVIGRAPGYPAAVLVRPDGYIAWAASDPRTIQSGLSALLPG